MCKSKEVIKDCLKSIGLPIVREDENSIVFEYQEYYVESTGLINDSYIVLNLYGFYKIKDNTMKGVAFRVCNDLNEQFTPIKVYLDERNEVFVACEFVLSNPVNVEVNIRQGLAMMMVAKDRFVSRSEDFLALLKAIGEYDCLNNPKYN